MGAGGNRLKLGVVGQQCIERDALADRKEGLAIVPGVKPDDVKLAITDEAIVIEGERKSDREETKGGAHLTKRQYGRFYRSLPLPEGTRIEDARAR